MKPQTEQATKNISNNIYLVNHKHKTTTEQTVKDIDGNVYHTVTIGTQVWMIENLKVTHYRNGLSIPNVTDDKKWSNLTSGACCDYDNLQGNGAIYGKLYNCYAIIDSHNLCPLGWHVPTNDEWMTMINYLGGKGVAGGKLKSISTPDFERPNTGASNESGFSALLGGIRGSFGQFEELGDLGFWWSSSETDTDTNWFWFMDYFISSIYGNHADKTFGFSVRCIRDC